MGGLVDKYCIPCIYGDNRIGTPPKPQYCVYYLDTGVRRPCKAGTGCTVRELGIKAKPLLGGRRRTPKRK